MANDTMLYKSPGPYQLQGGSFDYIIIDADTPGAIDAALAEGWYASTPEALANATPVIQTTGLNLLQFMNLFTEAEKEAIVTSNDVKVKLFVLEASGAPTLDLDNPSLIMGINYLAMIKLIASDRIATILAGIPQTKG